MVSSLTNVAGIGEEVVKDFKEVSSQVTSTDSNDEPVVVPFNPPSNHSPLSTKTNGQVHANPSFEITSSTKSPFCSTLNQDDHHLPTTRQPPPPPPPAVAISKATEDKLKHHNATWSYLAILWLFRLVMRVFYSNVVVEGSENIPGDGVPCMLCANHSNSITDALLLVTTVPRSKRQLLRLTAKSSQFGKRTFTSWLIESAGTLPIKRAKEHGQEGKRVDNSVVFQKLIESLEHGDMICMFPEGLSRYYPTLAPLKQGVSRIISDVLSRQKDNASFELAIQTCSITYLHRNLFRSDVLVTFHPPIMVSARTHPGLVGSPSTPSSYEAVRSLTTSMGEQIRSGTLDAPSWQVIRVANTARRLYAPLGTKLGLGDHVRLTQRFVECLAGKKALKGWKEGVDPKVALKTPMIATPAKERKTSRSELNNSDQEDGYFAIEKSAYSSVGTSPNPSSEEEIEKLSKDLKTYQDLLYLYGVKDDRVRNPRMLLRRILIKRLFIRIMGAAFLFIISLPGLLLWLPVFTVAKRASEKQKKTGPVYDTFDEVAHTKLVYGFITGVAVNLVVALLTLPILPLTIVVVPFFMWVSLRWIEDCTSSLRAALALLKLLQLGKGQLIMLREMREDLRARVEDVAVRDCGLPRDSGKYLESRPRWRGLHAGFFSLRRRRKKDWNEVLRLWDVSEFPDDDFNLLPPQSESDGKGQRAETHPSSAVG